VDETSTPLIKETRLPLPAQAGQPPRLDDEYERPGPRQLWLLVAPPTGQRQVQGTAQRTKVDVAHARPWLVDLGSPDAEGMRGGLDQRNTHTIASLADAVEPAEARRIARKLEVHDTPKPGSGLHMAAMELRVLHQPCLDRRRPDAARLRREIAAGEHQRNLEQATIDWRFAVSDARNKRKRLSPALPS
jgi:hypothetical protein